ncbi:plastocyanin/azurin family copper-binding protein [Frankia sp. AgB32]|uniref:plastocyanin/azurin family copper-binding protein n=1 Tax=Frankia sp. AgB32 TaxID=631119 RepID=UPI00200C8626|nr:plastocyanin/azurin family copper-binding protein [Frankia sp. AgB32]MCK9897323.1 plastocyanin/azurin family copper-binding protein [Frankia sp. AgB32]
MVFLTLALAILAACGSTGTKNTAAAAPGAAGTATPGFVPSGAATPPPNAMPGMTMPRMTMPGMTMAAAGAAGAASAPAATGNAVAIKNFAFDAANLTVRVGTTVTWTNQDGDAHTVVSSGSGPLHSPTLDTGDTYQYTFTKAGTYSYLCSIHPFMLGSVRVTA